MQPTCAPGTASRCPLALPHGLQRLLPPHALCARNGLTLPASLAPWPTAAVASTRSARPHATTCASKSTHVPHSVWSIFRDFNSVVSESLRSNNDWTFGVYKKEYKERSKQCQPCYRVVASGYKAKFGQAGAHAREAGNLI
jgi:hypothetical protein